MLVLPRIDFFPLTGFVVPPTTERRFPSPNTAVAAAAAAATSAGPVIDIVTDLVFVVFVPEKPPFCLMR